MLEFFTERERSARKRYTCDLCGGTIEQMKKYVRYSGKYEGEMFDYKYHTECIELTKEYCKHMGECEYDEDRIRDWISDAVCCDLCDDEQRDDCMTSKFRCDKVLDKLGIKMMDEVMDAEIE